MRTFFNRDKKTQTAGVKSGRNQERTLAFGVSRQLNNEEIDQVSGGCATTAISKLGGDACDHFA